ncbi:MAG: hypothetical protein ACOCRK_02020 [bacterium]
MGNNTIFTKPISHDSLQRMFDNIDMSLDAINNTKSLLCPHMEEIGSNNEEEESNFKSKAQKVGERDLKFYIDDHEVSLKGNMYRCSICGAQFFVPTQRLNSSDSELERFATWAQMFLNSLKLFKGFVYADPVIRGGFDGDMGLNVPRKVRNNVGTAYLKELAGWNIHVSADSRAARADRSLQLDRSLFLAHLEALEEIYTSIVKYLQGEEVIMAERDLELGSFMTGVGDGGYNPYRGDIPNTYVESRRDPRYLDSIVQPNDRVDDGYNNERLQPRKRTKKSNDKKKNTGMKKDV